jgi:hypothetical protein
MRTTYLPAKVPETICSDEPIKTSYSQQIQTTEFWRTQIKFPSAPISNRVLWKFGEY